MMKRLILLLALGVLPAIGQQAITVTVTLSADHIWALRQDWADHQADTNNPVLTQIEWFRMNATNQILRTADRRVTIRKQELHRLVAERWPSLTPEQMTNVVNALPAQ